MILDLVEDVPHVDSESLRLIRESGLPVIQWGAGELAWYIWNYLAQNGIQTVAFCDSNPSRHGTNYLGLPVMGYAAIRNRFGLDGYHVVVSTGPQYKDAIYASLAEASEVNPIWYFRGYEVCGQKIDYDYLREHAGAFDAAYRSLSDERSRKVFANVMNAKISGDFGYYQEIRDRNEYFDEQIVSLDEHEVYLDIGSFGGNAIIEFVRKTAGRYDGIIALEPDRKHRHKLHERLVGEGVERVSIYEKGAWDCKDVLFFNDGREGGSRISEETTKDFAGYPLEVDTVDNLVEGRRVTYLSMDIEGAERRALLGATRTIQRWKPKLAVSVYHRREDLADLPALVLSLNPEYRLYLRHYTDNQADTVLYAV